MRPKPLIVVVALLAAASGAVYFLNRPAPPRDVDPRVNQPILAADTAAAASHVRIANQGKTVDITRQSDGTWTVDSYHDLPADLPKLTRFIGELTAAKIDRVVTRDPAKLARLEFSDAKVELLGTDPAPLWSLTLGKTAESGGRFLRFGTEPIAYLARLSTSLDAEAKNWADSRLLDLKADDIAKVEITFPEGAPLIATRAKNEDPFTAADTPEGQSLQSSAIVGLVGSLGRLRFSDTAATDDPKVTAARAHTRSVILTTFAGRTVTLTLAREPLPPPPPPPPAPAEGETAPPPPPAPPSPPVFVHITDSDSSTTLNAVMKKRAFQIQDYTFTRLPQTRAALFESKPASSTPASVTAPISVTTPPLSIALPPKPNDEKSEADNKPDAPPP